jgi:hypothetical protein
MDKLCNGSNNTFGLVLGMLFFGFIVCMIFLPLLRGTPKQAPTEPETDTAKPGSAPRRSE